MMNLERKAANYLDPRWKGVHLRLTNRLQQTKVEMKAKYLGEDDVEAAEAVEVDLPNASLSPTSKLLFNSQREEQVRVSGLEQEMRRYEASGNPGRNVDVLDFWKQNQDVFPLVLSIFQRPQLKVNVFSQLEDSLSHPEDLIINI